MDTVLSSHDRQSMETYELVIVGSGPAGLAAASHAATNGLSYVLLERTDPLADPIDAYQARKYVMAEPMMIPARGEVPFAAGSREAILAAWDAPVADRGLNVRFGAEVKALVRENDRFRVTPSAGEIFDAARVV